MLKLTINTLIKQKFIMDYKWFYRSDKKPMMLHNQGAQWTYNGNKINDDNESPYQYHDFQSKNEE